MFEHICFESCGRFLSRERWIHPRRCLLSHEFIFIQQGEVHLEGDGTVYALHAGQLLCLSAGKVHFGTQYSEEPVEFYWLHFRGELPFPCKFFSFREYSGLLLLFRQCLSFENCGGSKEGLDYWTRLICMEIYRQLAPSGQAPARLREIWEWIRSNSDRPLHAVRVAERFGYNADYLNRLFCRYGKGLKESIVAARIDRVKSLLLNSNQTIGQIAAECGFPDSETLRKFFCYHEKISPTRFAECV